MTRPSSKRTLYLHVGQGKTGSSFIQSSLALSVDELMRAGVAYPSLGKDHERALSGQISMGNLRPQTKGLHSPAELQEAIRDDNWNGQQALLLSNEVLFQSLLHDNLTDAIATIFNEFAVKILCFIRDPLDHALSSYQQKLKEGNDRSASDHLIAYNVPRQLRKFLDRLEPMPVELKILNYSRHKNRLLEAVAGWLGLEERALITPPVKVVNRSLTRTEMEIQRAFNQHVGRLARLFVSDALANELPNIRSEQPPVSDTALEIFLARMNMFTEEVNPRLPESERYTVPSMEQARSLLPTEEQAEDLHITPEQIEVLARNMARWFKAVQGAPAKR